MSLPKEHSQEGRVLDCYFAVLFRMLDRKKRFKLKIGGNST